MCTSVFAWAKTDTRAPLERPRYLRGAYIMNYKKLLLTLTLCLCMLLGAVSLASAEEDGATGSGAETGGNTGHSHALCYGTGTACTDPNHDSHSDVSFDKKLSQGEDGTLYIGDQVWTYEHNVGYILPAGTYYLGTDLTLDHQIRISNSQEVKVTLCLNGKTITCTENYDAVIQTPTTYPVEFTLCDCRPSDSVGKITHANGRRGVGVELKNNNAVNDVAHKFIMYNGCITGNKTTNGAGVFLYSNTTFTMYGGSITENECNSDMYPPCGGGVYVHNGATFTMYGGDITKNQADYGGGVSTSGDTANFTMYGGSITENHANKSGGGIYSTSNNISIYGGSVTDNSVTKNGKAGGIYVSSSDTLTVGGNVNISGNWQGDSKESGSKSNVYLNGNTSGSSATIVIEKKLTGENSRIGVTTATPVATTKDASVKIAAGKGTYAITDEDKGHFTPDTGYCEVQKKNDGIYLTHVHSGGTATCTAKAKCGGCSQSYGNTNPNNHALVHHEAQAPTCTAVGWEAYDTCSRCTYTTYREIPAAHTYGAVSYTWATDNTTCKAEHKCTACQHVENETVNTQQTVTQNRSCTLNELSTFTATFTNTAFVQQTKENVKTADMTPHTYSATEWESNVDNHWHECSACHTQIDKAEHTWKDATYTAPKTCTVCGATQGEPLTRSYYYYAPSAAENKKDSPKTADPGVLLYAGLAFASLTGLACTAKKRH